MSEMNQMNQNIKKLYEDHWKDKPFLIPCKNSECEIRENFIIHEGQETGKRLSFWSFQYQVPEYYYTGKLRSYFIEANTQDIILKNMDSVTRAIIRERLKGTSYEKIAVKIAIEHKVMLSWQAIQQRVKRHMKMLL